MSKWTVCVKPMRAFTSDTRPRKKTLPHPGVMQAQKFNTKSGNHMSRTTFTPLEQHVRHSDNN